eukprot:6361529-Amphidinium_carterae.1
MREAHIKRLKPNMRLKLRHVMAHINTVRQLASRTRPDFRSYSGLLHAPCSKLREASRTL